MSRKGDFGLIIFVLGWLPASEIQAVTLLGETEVGQRSTSEDFDGEDQEDDYHYLNGHLALDGRISSKLTAESDAYRKTKDYEFLNDLDNQMDAFTVKPILLLRDDDKRSLKADFRANYRHKRYENQPRLDYNQIDLQPKITLQKTSVYSVSALAGWKKYYYPSADGKDQSNVFQATEGRRYFLDADSGQIVHTFRWKQSTEPGKESGPEVAQGDRRWVF